MVNRFFSVVSFGERFVASTLVYTGLGLFVLGMAPGLPRAAAQPVGCDGESVCPEGTFCCGGVCVPNDNVCCGDGTTGGSSCYCCTGCSSTCSSESTVACP